MVKNGQTSPVLPITMNDASYRDGQPAHLIIHALPIHPTFTSLYAVNSKYTTAGDNSATSRQLSANL